jgi:hypothetical protein
MTGSSQPQRVADPYLTKQGVGPSTSWAPTGVRREPPGNAWENWAVFAAVLLLMAGVGHVLIGLLALFDASYFDPAESDPALEIGYTAWGWIQVAGGAFLLAAGGGLLARKEWARLVAIVLAGINAVSALAFLPTAPVWGALLVTLAVMIVYALTVHRTESSGPIPAAGRS